MRKLIAIATLALAAAGCATTDAPENATTEKRVSAYDKEYTTGSRVPRRPEANSGVTTMSREQLEREQGRIGQLPSRTGNP
ncbi:hypothetical protein BWI17_07475 [Betaproteobacteria bacterium GR16-43]|nr:hypothetical protein BWI17_07475 [Betaproteobacteria bacterium GR16-43]